MRVASDWRSNRDDLIAVFRDAFTASGGDAEGKVIEGLVRDLFDTTPTDELHVFYAHEGVQPVGAILFSRMIFADDPRYVFLLSPVAVVPAKQRQGVGQALIRKGLEELSKVGVDIVVTYGDPAYYGQVGFARVAQDLVPPPFALSQPHGWIVQALKSGALATPLSRPVKVAPAFNNPAYW